MIKGAVSRLAPTPSGHLHLGNLFNFALTSSLVRQQEGRLILRIDDADETRERQHYVDEIHEVLKWLGFDWDQEISQQARKDTYREWLEKFPRYACSCSRKEIEERTGGMLYDGHCFHHPPQLLPGTFQWRLRSPAPADDVVLWRKDDLPAYHLASLVDDLTHGVNLVVRGEDLRESTRVQRLMASILGVDGAPFLRSYFVHHELLLGPDGKKLSKSAGAHGVSPLKTLGSTPREIWRELGRAARLPIEVRSLRDFLGLDLLTMFER